MDQYRQGDVFLERVAAVPEGGRLVDRHDGRIVLAYGEVTGHAHAIADPGAELFDLDDWEHRYLVVSDPAGVDLRHEEHAPIHLDPGVYEARHQREYAPGEIRRVAD